VSGNPAGLALLASAMPATVPETDPAVTLI
jgi:hypothetical protein